MNFFDTSDNLKAFSDFYEKQLQAVSLLTN